MKKILFSIVIFLTQSLLSQTSLVTNISDSGNGSLRSVIANSNNGDIIRFHPDLLNQGSQTILLNSTIKLSEKKITIKGLYNSEDTLFISGQGDTAIFSFENSESIYLDSLIIIDGFSSQNGGGIEAKNIGYFQFNNGIIQNCSAKNGSAISFQEDSLYQSNMDIDKVRLELNNSYFEGNSSEICGGVINISIYKSNYNSYDLSNGFTISPTYYRTLISKTTFVNNSAKYGGVFNASLSRSTNGWGQQPTFGYCLYLFQDIKTCTFYNNAAKIGSDLYNAVGYSYIKGSKHDFLPYMGALNKTQISNSTFYSNLPNQSSSIYNVNYESGGANIRYYKSPVQIKGSIVYSPNLHAVETKTNYDVKSLGYNIFSDLFLDSLQNTDIQGINNNGLNLSSIDYFNNSLIPTLIPKVPSLAINNGDPNDFSEAQTGQIYGVREIGSGETCKSFSFQNETEYDEFSWINDSSYFSSDDSLVHIVENTFGCDSVIFMDLTIITPSQAYLKTNPVLQGEDIVVYLGDNLFEEIQFILTNIYGQTEKIYNYSPNDGENILRIPTEKLVTGVYFIKSQRLDYNLKIVVY